MNNRDLRVIDLWLSRYAKMVVVATFLLIMIGGHTTTTGAGMAFPDWPLSHGSLNPNLWWADFMQRLEHGHRMTAEFVGLLVGVLCAWVWRSKWSLPLAFAGSIILAAIAHFAHAKPSVIAHVGLWSSAAIFTLVILAGKPRNDAHNRPAHARWIAFAAFLGVCAQAVMGGLRVTMETAGESSAAITFRVLHGCFAQFELCLLVALAAILSPCWSAVRVRNSLPSSASRMTWIATTLIYLQLIVGATMRHHGAGLAIPTFPHATADGRWVPAMHTALVDLNFMHTRVGALMVTFAVIICGLGALRTARGERFITRPAALLLILLIAQVTVGILVVWQTRPPILTTFHVLNGAALLSTSVLLAMRVTRRSHAPAHSENVSPALREVHA